MVLNDESNRAALEEQASKAHEIGLLVEKDEHRRQEIEAAEALIYQQIEEKNFRKMKEREQKRQELDLDIKRRHSVKTSPSSPMPYSLLQEGTEEYYARQKKSEEDAKRAAQVMADLEDEHERTFRRLYYEQVEQSEMHSLPDESFQLRNRLGEVKKCLQDNFTTEMQNTESTDVTIENISSDDCQSKCMFNESCNVDFKEEDLENGKGDSVVEIEKVDNAKEPGGTEVDSCDCQEEKSLKEAEISGLKDDVANENLAVEDVTKLQLKLEAATTAALLKKKKKKAAKMKAQQESIASAKLAETARQEETQRLEEEEMRNKVEAERRKEAALLAEKERVSDFMSQEISSTVYHECCLDAALEIAHEEYNLSLNRRREEHEAREKASRLAALEAAMEEAERNNKAREAKRLERLAAKQKLEEEVKAKELEATLERKRLAQEANQREKERIKVEQERQKAEKIAKLRLQLNAVENIETNIASLKAEHAAGEQAAREVAEQRRAEVRVGLGLEEETVDALCLAIAENCFAEEHHLVKLREAMKVEEELEKRKAEERLRAERERNRHLAQLRKEARRKAREDAAARLNDNSQSLDNQDFSAACVLTTEHNVDSNEQEMRSRVSDGPELSADEQKLYAEREAKAEAARQRKIARRQSRLSHGDVSTAYLATQLEILPIQEPFVPNLTFRNIDVVEGTCSMNGDVDENVELIAPLSDSDKIDIDGNERSSHDRADSLDIVGDIIVGTETFSPDESKLPLSNGGGESGDDKEECNVSSVGGNDRTSSYPNVDTENDTDNATTTLNGENLLLSEMTGRGESLNFDQEKVQNETLASTKRHYTDEMGQSFVNSNETGNDMKYIADEVVVNGDGSAHGKTLSDSNANKKSRKKKKKKKNINYSETGDLSELLSAEGNVERKPVSTQNLIAKPILKSSISSDVVKAEAQSQDDLELRVRQESFTGQQEAGGLSSDREVSEIEVQFEAEHDDGEVQARFEGNCVAGVEDTPLLQVVHEASEEGPHRLEADCETGQGKGSRLEVERDAASEDTQSETRLVAERKVAEEEARLLAQRDVAGEESRLAAECKVAEEEARLQAQREAAEEESRLEEERRASEEEARLLAQREVAEEESRLAAECKVAEEEARLQAQREAAEEESRLEEERKAIEEEARLLAQREAAEEESRLEAERKVAEKEARLQAQREAAEEESRLEEERKAIEEEARLLAQREAAEEESRLEAELKVAEEEARLQAQREAAEEESRLEAELKVAEEEARLRAQREAAEEESRLEAERKVAEEEARVLAQREAAEEESRLEAELKVAEEEARLRAQREAAEEETRLLAAKHDSAVEDAQLQLEHSTAKENARLLEVDYEETEKQVQVHKEASEQDVVKIDRKVQEDATEKVESIKQKGVSHDEFLVEYTPVLVMKSLFSDDEIDKRKIFLNICSHMAVPKDKIIIGLNCPQIAKDKSGDDTLVYDICVACEQFHNDKSVEGICSTILNFMNSRFNQEGKGGKIDLVYKIPKIKNQFKGSHVAKFVKVPPME